MAFGTDAVLLGDLPLEEMDLRAVGRQRGKPVRVQRRLADVQQARGRCRRGRRTRSTLLGRGRCVAEEGGDALPAGHGVHDGPAEVGEGQLRDLAPRDRLPRVQNREAVVVHRFTSKNAAASRSSDSRGGGM